MDYTLPENLRLMRDTVSRFVKNDLEPISQKVEEEGKIPEGIVQKMRDLGFFGLSIPEEYGGMGLGTLGECVLNEEFGRVNSCFRSRFGTNNGIGSQGILIDGTPEQKEKYLPRIASGEWTAAFALTEPNAGSDAANIQTKAEKRGDVYLLNGLKHFITNGDIADVVTVMAVTDKTKGPRGVTAFIVEKTFPGYSVGKIDQKMGIHGNNTSEIVFEDCQVPVENIIGLQEGRGFSTAMKVLEKGRITIAAVCVGTAQYCLDVSIAHSKQRVQFGKPICVNQAIQWMLADMAISIYTGRQIIYHTAWCRDQKQKVTQQAAMCKVYCTEMVNRVADSALQIHGGMGYMKESPIERIYRDMRLFRIFEGTSEVQRMVIARELLKD
ncbi:MAG TPA: acyl-CoA dehydrogenase family protein [Thermodesulfobacteriota bacterium]|nr:acyl-CoA dehydrogenase family protein [Thermodesulfobacteriota bacterium]